jgi:hypothetical protein
LVFGAEGTVVRGRGRREGRRRGRRGTGEEKEENGEEEGGKGEPTAEVAGHGGV